MQRLKHYTIGLIFYFGVLLFLNQMIAPYYQVIVVIIIFSGLGIGILIWTGKLKNSVQLQRWSTFSTLLLFYVGMRIVWLTFTPIVFFGPLHKANTEIILFLIFLFFLQHFQSLVKRRAWENSLIAAAIILAAIELFLAFNIFRHWWAVSELMYSLPPIGVRVFGGGLGHPNVMSGFLNLVIPILLAKLVVGKSPSHRIAWAGVLVLFVVVQYFSSSRGGWISGTIAILVTLALLYFPDVLDGNFLNRAKEVFTWRRIIVLGFLAIISLFAFNVLLTSAMNAPGHGGRVGIWVNSFQVWQPDWIVGQGTGAFPSLYAQTIQAPPGWIAEHAHNLFIQMGSENGILGIGFAFIFIYLGASSWLRAWRSSPNKERKMLAAYAGAGVSIFVHNMGDYLFTNILYTVSVLFILSLIIVRDPHYKTSRLSNHKFGWVLIVSVAAIGAGLSVESRGLSLYDAEIGDGANSDWRVTQEKICAVADDFTYISDYQFQCGLSLANQYYAERKDETLLLEATNYYQRGLIENPYWPVDWANLAIIQWQIGETGKAITSMQKALEAAPRNAMFAIQLGRMAEEAGNYNQAEENYSWALRLNPWMTESDFFVGSAPKINALNQQDYMSLLGSAEQLTFAAYREQLNGNFAKAEELIIQSLELSLQNYRAHVLYGVVLNNMGKYEEAWINVQLGLLIRETPQTLNWASQVALSQGREVEAISYAERAFWLMERHYSKKYFAENYASHLLPSDLVPGYLRADVLPDMVESLYWLVDHYAQLGEIEKEKELSDWLLISGLERVSD